MTPRRRVAVPDPNVSQWNGYTRGDPVRIQGLKGSWVFHSARLDDAGIPQWVTVVGGAGNVHQFRSFVPGRIVSPLPPKRVRPVREPAHRDNTRLCSCGNVIPPTGRPGRPFAKCPTCRGL